MSDAGYIYIKNWAKFQHYHDRPMVWFKTHTDLLDNDAFRRLPHGDRSVLFCVWILSARAGNGRVSADLGQLSAQVGRRVRQLDSLIQAGFITIRASKAAKPCYHSASQEKNRGSKEPKKRSALAKASPLTPKNGDHPSDSERPLTREERQREAQEALARIASMPPLKDIDNA